MVRELFKVEPYTWQMEPLEKFRDNQRLAMVACKGPGKGHPKSLMIPTPDGLRQWGHLNPGDSIFAEDGSVTQVKRRHELGVSKLFRVSFDDGSSTLVTGGHLWKVRGATERRKGIPWVVIDTKEIIKRGVRVKNGRWAGRQWEIPQQGRAQFPRGDQALDPYLCGIWLGDGSRKEPSYCKPYVEVEHEINRRGYQTTRRKDGKQVYVHKSRDQFEEIECFSAYSYDRFIPDNYKFASVQQRTDLLCGLMDADGSIGKEGSMEFASTSKRLADDVVWIVRSLGGVGFIKDGIKQAWYTAEDGEKVICRDCYRVTVSLPFNPFRIPHKADRWKDPFRSKSTSRYLTRYIDGIESAGEEDAMCIEVTHLSKCYVANDFIVTHNTTTLAWLIWNFMLTRLNPNIACISVDSNNLSANLWKECAYWRGQSPLLQSLFEQTKTAIFSKEAGKDQYWFCEARSWKQKGNAQEQASSLAGLHAKNILFVIDEAGSMPDSILASAEAALSNCEEGHIVMAGNPERLEGPLYRAARSPNKWVVINITGDPDDPNRASSVDINWAREQISEWGRDSDYVKINVLGQFPSQSANALISEDDVDAAMKRFYREDQLIGMARVLGVDVAFSEVGDASVVARRQGLQMYEFIKRRGLNSNQGASLVSREWDNWGADAAFVDATGGYGEGWIAQLSNLGKAAIGVKFNGTPHRPDAYKNKRAEMAWDLVQYIKQGGALPQSTELRAALTRTYYYRDKDRLFIEPKDMVKAKIGFSPDEFDASILCFADPVSPKANAQRPQGSQARSAVGAYNPFAELDRISGQAPRGAVSSYNPFETR